MAFKDGVAMLWTERWIGEHFVLKIMNSDYE